MDLLTKRSKRCPVSNSLIVKPELNPSKASFQKKSDAFSKLPRATVVLPIDPSGDCLMVRFSNPLEAMVRIYVKVWDFCDTDGDNSYLFNCVPFSTTIGEGFLDPGVSQPLTPEDDPSVIMTRTSNSVIVKLTSSTPVDARFVQVMSLSL